MGGLIGLSMGSGFITFSIVFYLGIMRVHVN